MKTKANILLIVATLIAYWLGLGNASAFYDPGAQRWLNRDPIGEKGGKDLFVYVKNGPVNRVDPLGLYGNPVSGPGGPVGPSGPDLPPMPPIPNYPFWNNPGRKPYNNCYNYGLDLPACDFRQPGQFPNGVDCASLKTSVKSDGASDTDSCGNCPSGTHKIRLWASPNGDDFHFYRQDLGGGWSDKPGSTSAGPVSDPNSYHNYNNCGDLCAQNQSPH